MNKRFARTFTIIISLVVLFFMPSIALCATQRQVHVEWDYTTVDVLAGFRLYLDGTQVCATTDTNVRILDCQVLLEDGQRSFTMTAFDLSGNESVHSIVVNIDVDSIISGDIDNNGIVDLNDLFLVQEILTGRTPSQEIHVGADVNGDGKIGMEEAQYILQHVSQVR